VRIRRWDNAGASEVTFALTRLGRQHVAHEGPFHLEFARGRLPEPLGGAAFRF
jgi:hypothetical protein